MKLALQLNTDTAQFFPLIPYPGTKAYNWAKAQNSDMILGPVFSSEVAAINTGFSTEANLLTYTSDSTVLDASHASFSMLIPNQINTIIQQLCSEGKTRLAALGSESKTGQIVMNSLDKAIKKCPNMENDNLYINHVGIYIHFI